MLNVRVEIDSVRIQIAANNELICRCNREVERIVSKMELYNNVEYDEAYLPLLESTKERFLKLMQVDDILLRRYEELKRLEMR